MQPTQVSSPGINFACERSAGPVPESGLPQQAWLLLACPAHSSSRLVQFQLNPPTPSSSPAPGPPSKVSPPRLAGAVAIRRLFLFEPSSSQRNADRLLRRALLLCQPLARPADRPTSWPSSACVARPRRSVQSIHSGAPKHHVPHRTATHRNPRPPPPLQAQRNYLAPAASDTR